MRKMKFRFAALVAIGLLVAGCAGTPAGDFFRGATVSVDNPITPARLKAVEDGMIITFAGLKAYKNLCDRRTIPASCRSVINSLQVYTRQIPPMLADLRTFVRTNDQVNAIKVYNLIMQVVAGYKSAAMANNVAVQ